MTNTVSEALPKSRRSKSIEHGDQHKAKPDRGPKSGSRDQRAPKANNVPVRGPETKLERLIALLSQPNGATIGEMMTATGWQQHSVRGFLAGTVKKKMGLALTSSKVAGNARRYRIATRRGR